MRQILFSPRPVLHIVRDRVLMAQTLVVPMNFQLLVLANAATFEIRNTRFQIVDLTSTSRGVSITSPPMATSTSSIRRRRSIAPTSGCSTAR